MPSCLRSVAAMFRMIERLIFYPLEHVHLLLDLACAAARFSCTVPNA